MDTMTTPDGKTDSTLAVKERIANTPETKVPAEIFRAYDIRGVVPEQLNEENLWLISRAVGSEALAQGIRRLLVGHDGRLSSPTLSRVLIDGLLSTGCDVVDLGQLPTPMLYFAAHHCDVHSGVMLTASHNPADYNGLKMMFERTSLADNQIQHIRQRIELNDVRNGEGKYETLDIKPDYIKTVCSRISLARNLKVVVDCGNAVPANIAPELFTALGCEVEPLFCEIDGSFPNHHPDPTVASNLDLLAAKVKETGADIGLAFDGDGDRLGLVTEKGDFVGADQLLIVLARDILPKYPGAPMIFDVKCSRALEREIIAQGGKAVMYRSGHSFMKQKMQETNAPLGGEYSAHVFIKDRWYGFDDGVYTAARLLEILAGQSGTASDMFNGLLSGVSTPEIGLPVGDERKFELIEKIVALADFPDARLITLDGLRIEWEEGWGLIRASNTSPKLLLRFEADNEKALSVIKQHFKALISSADKSIDLTPI